MKTKPLRRLALLALAASAAVLAPGYDIIKHNNIVVKWPGGRLPMRIKLGNSPTLQDGTNYSTSALAAMDEWNAHLANFQFSGAIHEAGVGGDNNDLHELFFASTVYGTAFEGNTIAVTTSYRTSSLEADGTYARVESDITFNNAKTWNSYRGPLQSGTLDLRRVALHELGHVLGLDHPDEATPVQSVSAVMNSHISSLDVLQMDDIDGAQSLYGRPASTSAPANDNFTNATAITLTNNAATATGSSIRATKETGEPNHAPNEPGGASVWWKLNSPATGTLVVDTRGSTYDTLVGGYSGTSVSTLTQLAANDDIDPGVVRTSTITFAVTAGTTYYIAVDGWDGQWGSITLNLALTATPGTVAPSITTQPASQTVTTGSSVTFSVTATGTPTPTYQWSKGGTAISGATSATYSISSAQTSDAGNYTVTVANSAGSVTSNIATLTVNAPAPPPAPAPSGGGGGGGGAPSPWFLAALAAAFALRRASRR